MSLSRVIIADLQVFADILSEAFPQQHNAHVTEYRVAMRNRAAAQASDALARWVKSGAFGRGISIEQFLAQEDK